MNVLVMGGNGFIGSHTVDVLLRRGHTVRVFDRSHERFRQSTTNVDFHQGEFSDTAALSEALVGIDLVFHMISTTTPLTAAVDPAENVDGNLSATLRLLELMRVQSVGRLVFLSSGGTVYGIPETDPVSESHPLRPISSFGIVKVAIESHIHLAQRAGWLHPVIVRPSNPYGPRQGHVGVQGVIGTFLARIAKGQPIQILGDGSVVRDFFHVCDLASLCVQLAEREMVGTYNAGSGHGHSISELLEMILCVTGLEATLERKPSRDFDVPRIVLDISAAKAATGWNPRIDLASGLKETWDWVLSQTE